MKINEVWMPIRYTFWCEPCDDRHVHLGWLTHEIVATPDDICFVIVHNESGDTDDPTDTSVVTFEDAVEQIEVFNTDTEEFVSFDDPYVTDTYADEDEDGAEPFEPEALARYAEYLNEIGVEAMYLNRDGYEPDLHKLAQDGWTYAEPGMQEGEPMRFAPGRCPTGHVFVRTQA